ncbi:MAG: hypothetical protein WEB57_13765 [Pseudohongiellaceae bacterium]
MRNERATRGLPVALWQGTQSLGWYRATTIDIEGMVVTGPIDRLPVNGVVTASVEFITEDAFSNQQLTAMTVRQIDGTAELIWINQQEKLRMSPSPARSPGLP